LIDQTDNSKTVKFMTLFRIHKNGIYNYAYKLLADADSAADVTQETFIRLYKKICENSHILDAGSWLFVVARNQCLTLLRKRSNVSSWENLDDGSLSTPGNSDINRIRLQKAFARLNTRHREALILKEYQGFSYEEIAGIMELSVSAVRSLLYKARVGLKENFEKITF
jgi:RNA polymerase sigma-70 factor (ECF subfamily)